MQREPFEPGTAEEWLRRARSNLRRAEQPKPEGVCWEDLCFDAQQAAEKAFKAVLVKHGLRFRFVHDLGELIYQLRQGGIEVPSAVIESVELTEYAVEARYPGPFEPVTEEEYRRAVVLASRVVHWATEAVRLRA